MSGSILHRRASGIHPGAFVQPTEPDTTDVQDGVFWLDTMGGPPYQLKRWDAGASTWHPVQMDTTGYPLPAGDRLEEYRTNQVADPLTPLVLEAVTPVPEPWPAGTYYFAYNYVTTDGVTGLSPSTSIVMDGIHGVKCYHPPPATLPPGVLELDVRVYLMPPVLTSGVYPGFNNGLGIAPWTILIPNASPDPEFPPLNNTGILGVRLVNPEASVYWQHDGTTFSVQGGDGGTVLEAPLPSVAVAPRTLVGQDPASGLPVFCPAPTAASDLLTVPAPPPADVSTCVQMRCGVSASMTGHLMSLYSQWARWLNPLFQLIGTIAFAAMLANLEDMFVVGEAAAVDAAVWTALKTTLSGLVSTVVGGMLPALDSDQQGAIQHPLFCALTCEGGEVGVSTEQVETWRTAIGTLSIFTPGTVSQELLQALLQYTPLQDWQLAAHGSGPSTACDAWTCP